MLNKKELDDLAKVATNDTTLQAIFYNPDNTAKIDAYFASAKTSEYETTATDGKKYKVTKKAGTPPTYTVTIIT